MFGNIKGHRELLSLLEKNVAGNECEGVYLFVGPSSVGKFTIAKNLAKYLLCTGTVDDSCRCETCRIFPQVPDYFEISNGNNNINSSDIDNLLEFLSLVPYRSRLRVAVIDNAHNINPIAASGLLKSFEDIKSNCLIVLVTHKPESLLPTITSRCYHIEFGRLGSQDVVDILKSKGHDSYKLKSIERMIPYFTQNFLVDFGKYMEYIKFVPKFMKDISVMKEDEILSTLKEIDEKQDMQHFVEVLIILLNDLLKIRYDSPDVVFNLTHIDEVEEIAHQLKEDLCIFMLEKLYSVHVSMNKNINLKYGQLIFPVFSWLYYFMHKEKATDGSKQ